MGAGSGVWPTEGLGEVTAADREAAAATVLHIARMFRVPLYFLQGVDVEGHPRWTWDEMREIAMRATP